MMKAGAFVRYRSGDGAGHVAWAFDVDANHSVAGSVENHSGHIFTPATQMGFWGGVFGDPVDPMRSREYDDGKWIPVERPRPLDAYRTMLWIEHQAYRAVRRNCEDDVYDVLRSYGVKNLPPPMWHWFPRGWFRALHGTQTPVERFEWRRAVEKPGAQSHIANMLDTAKPKCPPWRRPWHPQFHLLKAAKVGRFLKHMTIWARRSRRHSERP